MASWACCITRTAIMRRASLRFKCAVRGCTEEESCDGRGGCGPNDVPADVVGLPLTASTIYYYDIYASELAALSTPKNNYCPKALGNGVRDRSLGI